MKRILSLVFVILLAVSICACESFGVSSNGEVAGKVGEFSEYLNGEFKEAFPDSLFGQISEAPVCRAEGRDIIITCKPDSSAEMTPDKLVEMARDDDSIFYQRFKDLVDFVGDDGVRLIIEYVDADGVAIITHTIDKAYDPYSTGGSILLVPDDAAGDGSIELPSDEVEDGLSAKLEEYCADNADRLAYEYRGLFDGAEGPNCHVEGFNLVLEYRYTKDITRWQFFKIIEETAEGLKPLADELAAAVGSPAAGLIIRCFDNHGENLLDYPVGGMSVIGELDADL